MCDNAQIGQVVTNRGEITIVHTPPSTAVIACASYLHGAVRVEVVDGGPGVPVTHRERLFRPLERGHSRAQGSELVLTIARGFVAVHGRSLWLEDTPNRGALTLPVRVGVR